MAEPAPSKYSVLTREDYEDMEHRLTNLRFELSQTREQLSNEQKGRAQDAKNFEERNRQVKTTPEWMTVTVTNKETSDSKFRQAQLKALERAEKVKAEQIKADEQVQIWLKELSTVREELIAERAARAEDAEKYTENNEKLRLRMMKEIDAKQKEVDELVKQNAELNDKLAKLKEEAIEKDMQIEEFISQEGSFSQKYFELQATMMKEKRIHRQEMDDLSQQYAKVQCELKQSAQNNSEENENRKQELINVRGLLKKLNGELAVKDRTIEEITKLKDEYAQKCEKAAVDILAQEFESLKAKMQEEINSRDVTIDEMTKRKDKYVQKYVQAQQDYDLTRQKLDEVTVELEALQDTIASIHSIGTHTTEETSRKRKAVKEEDGVRIKRRVPGNKVPERVGDTEDVECIVLE